MCVENYCRYGHGSCKLAGGQLVVVGGYGELSAERSAPHSRLSDVIKIETNGWKVDNLETQGTSPGIYQCVPCSIV